MNKKLEKIQRDREIRLENIAKKLGRSNFPKSAQALFENAWLDGYLSGRFYIPEYEQIAFESELLASLI